MHPPCFSEKQNVSDWPTCFIELHCCRGMTLKPVGGIIARRGNRTFKNLVQVLRCSKCGSKPAPVYLCASHFRTGGMGGSSPDWAVELVPIPKPAPEKKYDSQVLPLQRAVTS